MKILPRLSLIVLLCWMTGCAKVNRQQLEQEVLAADPEFRDVLEKRQELANRVQTYERELALKRTSIERNITQLRQELSDASQNVKTKTQEIRKRMEPDQERINLALSLANEKLRAARTQRTGVTRSVAKLRKALQSGAGGTEAELKELEREASRLDQEFKVMQRHVRLLRAKLLLLKL